MGAMGYGYGSECHLLRWMGRHRKRLDELVVSRLGKTNWRIEWLDFMFDKRAMWPDAELTGLEFLDDANVKAAWDKRWPVPRRPRHRPFKGYHNWDAVGWVSDDHNRELLLVEAKAEMNEIRQDCGSTSETSRTAIRDELGKTQSRLQIRNAAGDWMEKYYQYANRLAVMSFLDEIGIVAHLLFIYLYGDLNGASRASPQSPDEWQAALDDQKAHIGEIQNQQLAARVHSMFLPVAE